MVFGRGRLQEPTAVTLRLEKHGYQVAAFCSTDGENWLFAGSTHLPSSEPVYPGIHAIGHINRELCTLRFRTTVLPGPADSVFDMDGNRVGDITSAALIPGTREGMALAMLRTSVTRPRATVRIQHQAESQSDATAIEAQVVGP